MISAREVVQTLAPLNGLFFQIPDLHAYAEKVTSRGTALAIRENSGLSCYILYYDNDPEQVYISMIWTEPSRRGQGLATSLLRQLVRRTTKEIRLEVNPSNPALSLYKCFGFEVLSRTHDRLQLSRQPRIAVMQPYLLPYIGYFHLARASTLFVFYDDVNYITRGWINRNRILLNGVPHTFTVPLSNASQNRLIRDTPLSISPSWLSKFERTMRYAYGKAPQFDAVMPMLAELFARSHQDIGSLAMDSVATVFHHLGLPFEFERASELSPVTRGLEKSERLIRIARDCGFSKYVNALGGKVLYTKEHFQMKGIDLSFIASEPIVYQQFSNEFVPWLSIIDVLMFNEPAEVRALLDRYKLE